MCQFAAYQPEKPPLSRRTVDCRVIFYLLPQARLAARNTRRTSGALPDQSDGKQQRHRFD
jgi:hypothetical protein